MSIMNKYKTLDQPSTQAKLAETIQKQIKTNRLTNGALRDNQITFSPMSDSKSIIFIKLPKKNKNQSNSFKTSLYESSLKRLKQQRVTLIKDNAIPSIKSKMNYQSFEEEVIRKALKQAIPKKKQNLPNLNRLIGEDTKKHNSLMERSQQKIQEDPQTIQYELNNLPKGISARNSIFQMDSSAIGFSNLKQKYLQLRQYTLRNQKKSQLLEKPQYRRYQPQKSLEEHDNKFKMEKNILDHMNRYNRKDFFQTKINGFKTRIYPHQKAQNKHEEQIKSRKKQQEYYRKSEHVQNFIRKKRRSFYPQTTISEYPNSSFVLQMKERETNPRITVKPRKQLHNLQRSIECTPWETDAQF